jgi:hypothetical protein
MATYNQSPVPPGGMRPVPGRNPNMGVPPARNPAPARPAPAPRPVVPNRNPGMGVPPRPQQSMAPAPVRPPINRPGGSPYARNGTPNLLAEMARRRLGG